jgi:hypothetical protein
MADSLSALADPIARRRALKLMAAGFALARLSSRGEADEVEKLSPAVIVPPGIVRGRANFYATAT